MAVTASGLFVVNHIAALKNTIAFDLTSAGLKLALYPSTITPDFSGTAANTAFGAGAYSGTEITGTNWATGGVGLTTPTVTESPSSVVKWTADNVSVSNVTLTGAYFGLIYDNSLTPKAAYVGINFGQAYNPTAGTLAINWAAGGIATYDLY